LNIKKQYRNGAYLNNQDYFKHIPATGHFLIKPFLETISPFIDFNQVRHIADIGSRDLMQSFEFKRFFPQAFIYAFEANPEAVNKFCFPNLADKARTPVNDIGTPLVEIPLTARNDIELFSTAVANRDGTIKFHPIDMEKSGSKNIGGSSLFKATEEWTRTREHWVQSEVEVPCITMKKFVENWDIEIDLVWMDVQGAELLVLEGFGDHLKKVKAIATEVGLQAYYEGHTLAPEINALLEANGFKCFSSKLAHSHEMDNVYINETCYRNPGTH